MSFFANGVLLVPTYTDIDQEDAGTLILQSYARLLPHWRVVGIDATRLIESAGALHCITMNLGPLGRLPNFPPPQKHAVEQITLMAENRNSRNEDSAEWLTRQPVIRSEDGHLADFNPPRMPIAPDSFSRRDSQMSSMIIRHYSRWQTDPSSGYQIQPPGTAFKNGHSPPATIR